MQLLEHKAPTIMVLPTGSVCDDGPYHPQRVEGDIPLAASDLFAGIVALAVRSVHIQDRIQHPAPAERLAATLPPLREKAPHDLPLSVCQIAGIMVAH